MNYFIINPDDKIANKLEIKLTKEELETTKPFVTYSKINSDSFSENLIFVRSLFQMTYLVSDELKDLLELYCDTKKFVPVFVIDKDNYNNKVYWKAEFKEIDCIKEPFEPSKNTYNINADKLDKEHIFTVKRGKATYLVVDLILMEHLLKRGFLEIQFTKTVDSNI